MGSIHLIFEGAGAESIDRALRSIFTVYGCPWAAHQFDLLETWQLNSLIADTQFPIVRGINSHRLRKFLERYADTQSKIYLWCPLPPSASSCDRLILEVEELQQSYDRVERIYLFSQEFEPQLWHGLLAKLNLETLQKLDRSNVDLIPYLNLAALEYTDKFGNIANSMIFSRSGSIDDYKILMLFQVIFNRLPPYLLI